MMLLASGCTLYSPRKEAVPPPQPPKIEVLSGLDNLLKDHVHELVGRRIALVTNQTGLDRNGVPNWKRLLEVQGATLVTVFTPEHGLLGMVPAGEAVESEGGAGYPFRVQSLYGKSRKPTAEMLEGVDLILYDIQDIGCRFYTYVTTLALVLEASAEHRIPLWVLDRPNPLTGQIVEGPLLNLEFRSFIGHLPIPIRYGLSPGEIAQWAIGEEWAPRPPDFRVIPMTGWHREFWINETTAPWTAPSPNIRDVDAALVYPGMALVEATNLSEGRGSEKPFRLIGAPWVEGEILASRLNAIGLKGVTFEATSFVPQRPTRTREAVKYEGALCHGVEIHVTEKLGYQAVTTGIALLAIVRELHPDSLKIDQTSLARLFGTDHLATYLDGGMVRESLLEMMAAESATFRNASRRYYLYE